MVVLINPFDVAPDVSDEEFLGGWQRAADYLQGQPGFRGSTLHRAVSPDPRFRFINVAEWDSPEAFRAAVGSPEFAAIARRSTSANYPALYQIVRTVSAGQPARATEGVPS